MTTRHTERANALRILAMDAVEAANSGHPGMPMGMADIAEVLFNNHIRLNPNDPDWPDRDRFLLSNGHGSMLQYAALHLAGFDVTLDDIRNFRQLHSRTPGHPENFMTPGVETTTGPLGQGFANAVGMALAEAHLAATFNRADDAIVDHHTWCFAGDGCMMEGISHEAASLAGHLGLGKLIVVYDDNGISIDGETRGWFSDDTPTRFEAYGWQVIRNVDGHNVDEIDFALETAKKHTSQPTLICAKTHIGMGAPTKAGTAAAHGAALGEDEIAATRQALGWADPTPFAIPDAIYSAWDQRERGAEAQAAWQASVESYAEKYSAEAAEFDRRMRGNLPTGWDAACTDLVRGLAEGGSRTATRKSSKAVLGALAPVLPEMIGGSADLSGSNGTDFAGHKTIAAGDYAGNYVYYGVREFGMTAITNGMSRHGGVTPFGATFLTFSDYARNAVRMAALMQAHNVLVYTHDSIGLGEDGPTHQPIEHLASLRLIPNLHVWRPGDDVETAVAWRVAVERRTGPVALALSRQDVDHQPRDDDTVALIERGGYVLKAGGEAPKAIIIATGSELELAMKAALELDADDVRLRVVSMPCIEAFEQQPSAYREAVLPAKTLARVAVEAGLPDPWYRYVGCGGEVIGVTRYGASAPGPAVYEDMGVTAAAVRDAILRQLDE